MPFNLDIAWFMADLKAPNPRAPQFDWTDERVARLKVLWAEGRSAAVIGAEFGITRNAVLGKVNRLRLETHKATPRKPRQPDHARIRLYDKGPRKSPTVAEQPIRIPECKPVSFMELGDRSCHYPVTDDRPFLFCGADNHGEHSYCGWHYSVCYMKPPRTLSREAQELRQRRMAKLRKGLAA